jgi:hypothetical protein
MRVDFTKAYHEETDRLLAILESVEKLSETRKPNNRTHNAEGWGTEAITPIAFS